MERLKLLLLSMLLITVMTSFGTARRHGHGHGHGRMHAPMYESGEFHEMNGNDRHPARDRRQGRGFTGQGDVAANIPGYPMKGPPSAPFVFPPSQQRGGPGGQARDNYNGSGNTFPLPSRHSGQPHHFSGNNFPVNSNNEPPPRSAYAHNPFLNSAAGRQPRPQDNFASRDNTPAQPRPQPPLKPNQYENINNAPAIQPVTNEFPTGEQIKFPEPTPKPAINPREFDLLYGSNLHEESQTGQAQRQPEGKSLDVEPGFDTRILLDSTPHCQEGYINVGGRCRPKV